MTGTFPMEVSLQELLRRLIPWQIRWRGILVEALLYLAVYTLWLLLRSPESPSRALVGNVAVLVPAVTAVILIFRSLGALPAYSRSSWLFLGIAMLCWSAGSFIRTFYEALRGMQVPNFSPADVVNFLAYPSFFYALILYPFENRYAPSRVRFLMDATIASGVVATLGWLILGRSIQVVYSGGLRGFIPLIYPIADLILLIILFNMLLANQLARRTTVLWGISLLAILISDYAYAYQASFLNYRAGGLDSIGWTAGYLLIGLGAMIETGSPRESGSSRAAPFDLAARFQNILPVTLVLALFWYVIVDWQMRGQVSVLGLWMCLLLAIGLIVRMAVRVGESELHKYWQLFSNLAEPTFICDTRGRIVLGNPALVRAVGFKEESQILRNSLTDLFSATAMPEDLLARAVRQECTLEVTLRARRTPYLLSLNPIVSEGRRALIAGVAYNLSEQKRQQRAVEKAYQELQVIYRQLEELNTQLEQKVEERTRTLTEAYHQLEEQNKILQELDQLKSDFISMVSHELRTPLTSISGGLELLLSRRKARRADQATLLLMRNEAQRLTRFVENILNLSAIEAGRLKPDLKPLSLETVVRDVCEKLAAIPGADRIRHKLPEGLPAVLVDESLLHSVLNHLLDNALKYALEGPVVIEANRHRNRIRVQVTDNGPGIPKEKRHLLFRRFQRLDVKDSQSVYGYGLGLYLSRRMLRAMDSDLAFEAAPGGGSRFHFSLKASHEDENPPGR